MPLIYKTLFEVRMTHEFYLSELKGGSIFQYPNQEDRIIFLQDRFMRGMPSISQDLAFELAPEQHEVFDNYHLRLLDTYSGFKVVVEVNATALPDGTVLYTPKIPLPAGFTINIGIVRKNPSVDSYTNGLFHRAINASYYFSNESITGQRSWPYLTSPVSGFDAGHRYEQGELVLFSPTDLREFFKDNNGDQWRNIAGNGFANENDRVLVSPRFYYHLDGSPGVTDFSFSLTDAGGNTAGSFSTHSNRPLQKVLLDFSAEDLITIPANPATTSAVYSYKVSASDNYTASGKLIFLDPSIPAGSYWGMVQVKIDPADPAFQLFDNNGFLQTRRNPDGSRQPAPVFEVPVTSRLTYWRYINDKKQKFNNGDYPSDFLVFTERALISRAPRPYTWSAVLFKKESDNTYHYLPQPTGHELVRLEAGQLFTDIIVPRSKLFPVVP